MPSNERKNKEKVRQRMQHQRLTDEPVGSGAHNPAGSIRDKGSADGKEASSPAIQPKKRGRPPKKATPNEGVPMLQENATIIAQECGSATNSPVSKKEKVFGFNEIDPISTTHDSKMHTSLSRIEQTPKRGRPKKNTRGAGRGIKKNGSVQRDSSIETISLGSDVQSVDSLTENIENAMQLDENLKSKESIAEKSVVAGQQLNVPIDFNNVTITFATRRNRDCRIASHTSLPLRQSDVRGGGHFIETMWNNLSIWLDDSAIMAFLCYIATLAGNKVVVVDSFCSQVSERPRNERTIKRAAFNYDPNEEAEVILMPLFHPGHWTILVHHVILGTCYVDSLHMCPLEGQRIELIKDIISTLCSIPRDNIKLINVPAHSMTVQRDEYSCGYFTCLYGENWALGEGTFEFPNFDLNYEKRRILWHVNELFSRDDVPYHPPKGVTPHGGVLRIPLKWAAMPCSSKDEQPQKALDVDDVIVIDTQQAAEPAHAVEAAVAGENHPDITGTVVDTDVAQTPITLNDGAIFKVPRLPVRRSSRLSDRLSSSRSPSPAIKPKTKPVRLNDLGNATKITNRCYMVHKGWHCAAASAKHYPEYFHSGELGSIKCPHCGAYLFPHETSAMCCRQGRVKLPPLSSHPYELKELIVAENNSREGKEFIKNMSRYNNLLQFASVSAGSKPTPAGGPMAVLLNGEFHRRISSMQAGTTQVPGFSQLYVLDPVEAMEHRRSNPIFTGAKIKNEDAFLQGHQLNDKTLKMLEEMIQASHPAAKAYKQAHEQLKDLLNQQVSTEELRFFRLTLLTERNVPAALKDPKVHPHQIVTPSTGEGMFAIHADPSGVPTPKGIWIENKLGHLHEIAPFTSWTDSLTYPLIFPCGDDGYHFGIPYVKPPSRTLKAAAYTASVALDSDDDPCHNSEDEVSIVSSDAGSMADSDVDSVSGDSRKNVSLRDHCKYRLAIRDENVEQKYHHILSCGGGLSQRWILDQAAKVDWQVATWLRKYLNLRVSTPENLLKYWIKQYNIQQRVQNPNAKQKTIDDIGSVIRLSKNHKNSHQFWQKAYMHCNTIFARCHDQKKARLFITFTNSREWPEFKENIYNNGQTFTDRFDLWMRVYTSKVRELRRDLYERSIFGNILGYGESLEFQARGGPHSHIIAQTDLEAIPSVIQEYIWAHIPIEPDKDDDTLIAQMHRELRELIHLQLHRCGDWCAPRNEITDRCQKGFPEPFSKITILYPDRPACYYRPCPQEGGSQIAFGNIVYDNSQVVSYNPWILLKYRVHHNVLYGYGNKANIKYALKYSFKGTSYAIVELKEESGKIGVDEPLQMARCHFRGSTEAWAQIQSMPLVRLSHQIVDLQIHLPDKPPVVFQRHQVLTAAQQIQQGYMPETKCSAYWKQWRNNWCNDPALKDLKFEQVPESFKWDLHQKKWVAYKYKLTKRPPIGRIIPVSPNNQELFALYALMRHFAGDPQELKMYNAQPCVTFLDAAIKHGLLEDDLIWIRTLDEAKLSNMPKQMIWLFVSILYYGHPSNALDLWNKYKDQMYDGRGLTAVQQQQREEQVLSEIDWRLFNLGSSCVQFGLPVPVNSIANDVDQAIAEFFYGDDGLPGQPNQPQAQNAPPPPLNSDQQKVFDAVEIAIRTDARNLIVPRRFFVYGDGGTGKTYLFGQIIKRLRKPPYSYKVLATASTGCAAILMPFGKTAHSTFRLGRDVSLEKLPSIPHEGFFARRIREADLIIIDEITMLNNTVIEVINLICKEMVPQYQNLPFGGKTVIFSGDFKQSLPVVPREGLNAQILACFQKSPLYNEFTKMKLTINQRMAQGQQAYLQLCREIGFGTNGEFFWIPPEFLVQSKEELIDFVYPNFQNLLSNSKELLQRLILAPKIDNCDSINGMLMDEVPGQVREYLSTDKPLDERPLDIDEIESEVAALNRRNDSGMPPHRLRLKVGCVVVLLQNKSDKEGLINGTRAIIEELGDHRIIARAINAAASGPFKFFIERSRHTFEEKSTGLKYERLQFPIKLAFALTIHKGQGQTINILGIDLETEVFSHGQLYTAFSRATDGNNVRVYAPNREKDSQGQVKVTNIVAANMLQLI